MSFLLYFIGSIVVITGMAWIATLAGVSQSFVLSAVLVLLAIAIFSAAARTRNRDA